MIYFPPDKMQNLVFKEAFKHMAVSPTHSVWIGVRRSEDGWVASNGQKVTAAMADWATGEPIVAGNCVVAEASNG